MNVRTPLCAVSPFCSKGPSHRRRPHRRAPLWALRGVLRWEVRPYVQEVVREAGPFGTVIISICHFLRWLGPVIR